ncbi:MAG TPA: NAD(P)-binding protein, partial [Thermoanaerobaculia bacterium]|nr:NAD(P)-binding protein [Thermoanaerobaculia bacterium]
MSSELLGPLEIVGAGPAGLAAAIAGCQAGRRVVVYERHRDVGCRFRGDFQGLENWSSAGDVLEELAGLGIEPTFDAIPFTEQVCYGPGGREHVFRSAQPFYYLITRGSAPGTLDHSLKQQALAAGAEIRFGEPVLKPPAGAVVASGPHRADALAIGYLFETDLADGAFAVLDDRVAPKGYGYLLVHGGRATL